MDLSLVPLHNHSEYMKGCCDLLNDEWKRSETARLHSLRQSCDTLPTSLVLIRDSEVIGHAKVSKIPFKGDTCFVESVVIAKHLRGKGFGRILMEKTESYCKEHLNLEEIYLSTHDKAEFYSKLGYKPCPPITIFGGSGVNLNYDNAHRSVSNNCKVSLPKNTTNKNVPVPPPLPVTQKIQQPINTKIFMKKVL